MLLQHIPVFRGGPGWRPFRHRASRSCSAAQELSRAPSAWRCASRRGSFY